MRGWVRGWAVAALMCLALPVLSAPPRRQPVIVSTDIGDDIDDAFALGLLLRSPELDVRGIASSWGDTALRTCLLQHLLVQAGRSEIPLAVGEPTHSAIPFSQARWAARGAVPAEMPSAAELILREARRQPGQVTLLVLGPLTDVAAALKRDPAGFAQLRRIVLMGGSVRVGYSTSDYRAPSPPVAEYNIAADISAAQAVFAAGVPITLLPLDATQVKLEESARVALFAHGDGLTDALTQLYYQWRDSDQPWASATPTLFDVVPVAQLLAPALCPTVPLRLEVDAEGYTRERPGRPNVQACLKLDKAGLIDLYMTRMLR